MQLSWHWRSQFSLGRSSISLLHEKNGNTPTHQDIDFFPNTRINTAIIYVKTSGNSCLRIYEKWFTPFEQNDQVKKLLDIVPYPGLVVTFPSHLYHEVIVGDKEETNESRHMIVMAYIVK